MIEAVIITIGAAAAVGLIIDAISRLSTNVQEAVHDLEREIVKLRYAVERRNNEEKG